MSTSSVKETELVSPASTEENDVQNNNEEGATASAEEEKEEENNKEEVNKEKEDGKADENEPRPSSSSSFPIVDFLSRFRRSFVLRSPPRSRRRRRPSQENGEEEKSDNTKTEASQGAIRRTRKKTTLRVPGEVDETPKSPLLANRVSLRMDSDDSDDDERRRGVKIPLAALDDCNISIISDEARKSLSGASTPRQSKSRLRRLYRWSSKQLKKATDSKDGGRSSPPIVVTMTDGIATIHTAEEMKEIRRKKKMRYR